MSDIKQPEDHKTKPKPYSFKGEGGKSYTLPFASKGAASVPGQVTRDAIMDRDDETAQMRLGFALLEACGASEAALAAVYAKPTSEMIDLLGEWMQHGDGEGAELPQS